MNLAALVRELALRHSDLVTQVLEFRLNVLSFILLFSLFLFEISLQIVVISLFIERDAI